MSGSPSVDEIRMTVPLPPNRGNSRWHWRTEVRKKKAYWDTLNMLQAACKIPRSWDGPTPGLVGVRVTLYVWNRMDRDNAMSRMKWIMDWLEAWEYIRNDGPGVRWAGLPEQVIDRKNQRVQITLARLRSESDALAWHEGRETA